MDLAYVDRKVVPAAEARVPLLDRGYLLGDGLFETMRATRGEVFRLEDHASRLSDGLARCGLPDGRSLFLEAVEALAGSFDATRLRISVTAGLMKDIPGGDDLVVTGIASPIRPGRPSVRCILSGHKDEQDPLATVKTLSFLPYMVARRAALAAGADDAIMSNSRGELAEATTANLFVRQGDVVYSPGPEAGALPGVTRAVLLERLDAQAMSVVKHVSQEQLKSADEAWLTNTTEGVIPLTHFQDRQIADGQPGAMTKDLRAAYLELVA